MHLVLRSRAVSLAPLLLLVIATVLGSGCSARDDVGDSGATVTATGSDDPATASTDGAPTRSPAGQTEGQTEAPSSLPAAAAAVCSLYSAMVDAVQDVVLRTSDPDEIAASIAPVMKEFAAQVQDLARPPDVSAEVWGGVEALAERILALPERPTDAEVEAVESQLTPEQRDAVASAYTWFKTTCVR